MQHTHVDASPRDCRHRIALHEFRRRRDGYAPWTIITKTDGNIIGWGGLYIDPFEPGWGVEVGYFFHPAAWGHGYATELIIACVALSDHVLGLPEIAAFTHPGNTFSRRVLEKAGFRTVHFVSEMDRFLFRRLRYATRPDSSPDWS